jgi:hypothetical protein
MPALDPRDRSSFEQIETLAARILPEWAREKNVLGIVPALKVTEGRVDPGALVLGFHVDEKVEPELLEERGYRPIPAEIEGIPTDVILARRPAHDGSVDERDTRSQMFDTLVGGIAVGNANMNAYGTLGMTLLAQSDGRMVGLTNEHVLVFDGDGQVGDEVQQPRFYLNSEVSLDPASCCPNGQLHYRGVDNPIVDVAVGVFAAAALAAALSDEIDPHRRGQDATVPADDETTLRETVSVSLDYPDLPLPGTPYGMGVDWRYERETDRQVLDHSVSEQKRNEHVIRVQHLITDRRVYNRGATVTFLALLGSEEHRRSCGDYFVTAAALSPSHHRAYKLILRPWDASAGPALGAAAFTHGDLGHAVQGETVRRCFNYRRQKGSFRAPRTIDGVRYDPRRSTVLFVPDAHGRIAMRLPRRPMVITLPRAYARITLRIERHNPEPVRVRAYAGQHRVDEASSDASQSPAEAEITLEAESIDRLVVDGGGGEALLLELCVEELAGTACLYRGVLDLASDEELGVWSTYLFAQTSNTVALGTDPLVAAQTIGSLPVTHNFVSEGESDNITYGHTCNVALAPDGSFEVVAPADVEIG